MMVFLLVGIGVVLVFGIGFVVGTISNQIRNDTELATAQRCAHELNRKPRPPADWINVYGAWDRDEVDQLEGILERNGKSLGQWREWIGIEPVGWKEVLDGLGGVDQYDKFLAFDADQQQYTIGFFMAGLGMEFNGFGYTRPHAEHAEWAIDQFAKAVRATEAKSASIANGSTTGTANG